MIHKGPEDKNPLTHNNMYVFNVECNYRHIMNSKILIIGIAILAIGTALYMIALTQLPEYETLIGSLARVLDSDVQQKYDLLKLFQVIGPVAGVAGFVISIAGLVSSPKDN